MIWFISFIVYILGWITTSYLIYRYSKVNYGNWDILFGLFWPIVVCSLVVYAFLWIEVKILDFLMYGYDEKV